jgi:predicted ATPase/class 3 adenylate cyclase
MEFRMLGPLEVADGGRGVALGGAKQRTLLGVLLLHAGEVVPVERLVDELWGERPPGSSAKLVQGYVSGLRRALGAGSEALLSTHAPGYALRPGPDQLDLLAFERLLGEARSAAEPAAAAERMRAALAVWRGPALANVVFEGHAQHEAESLNARRLAALGERIDLDLELGRDAALVGELEALVAEHPFRERLRAQLMLALYRSGRQADALRAYQDARRRLVDELGLEPGQELQQLERRILAHDPSLDAARPAAAPAPEPAAAPPARPPASRRVRKSVTAVFCDVVEWSALAARLDPESLHDVQARYHQATAAVLQRHGGSVEKFIGDAAVAVFGVPVVHEDDALRAVRAAAEIRAAVAALNDALERDWGVRLTVHTGVNTGEVMTGDVAAGHSLATGDAVVVAARLQQAAPPGEILLGDETYRLVRDAVDAEAVEPLLLKGREEPVVAWRLIGLAVEEPSLRGTALAPVVGRSAELAALRAAFERAVAERTCRLVTVLGPPGIGKSRLARELVDSMSGARVVVGRCMPYGEGITFWPLAEIVRELAGDDPTTGLAELMRGDDRASLIAERIAGAAGLGGSAGPPEETFWAVRKLFERLAREQPLIVVVDDVHWAEPTLLDLIEYLVGFTSDVPVFVLCLARPELLQVRPEWAAPSPAATLIALEPLSGDESRELLTHLQGRHALPERALGRVVEAAEGNPLFLEQLHVFQAEQGGAAHPIPPSIHALLSARIERLAPDERTVLERASIEGRTFHLGALSALLPEELSTGLPTLLMALVRMEFIRSDGTRMPGDEAFRFRHLLIRDAAYGALPKQVRSDLHERYAAWLEGAAGEGLSELEDVVGYHLEQAFRYRQELGTVDAAASDLAARAAAVLASAGHRALRRGDVSAAIGLLGRAAALLPANARARLELLPDLGLALTEAGELARAEEVLIEAEREAGASGEVGIELNALIERAALHLLSDPESDMQELLAAVEGSLTVLAELGDDRGQGRGWYLIGLVRGLWAGRQGVAETALARALTHVRRTGDTRQEAEILNRLAFAASSGPTPLPEAIARCEAILDEAAGDPMLEAGALRWLAPLEARRSRFDHARELVTQATERYEELGMTLMAVTARAFGRADIELLAGEQATAEDELRRAYDALGEMGEQRYRSSVAAYLARPLYAQGRYEEAERFTRLSEETAADDDPWSQVLFRTTRAKVLARRELHAEAEVLATEALALVEETDLLDLTGDTLLDLAEVLRLGGREPEAAACVERALACYTAKGNDVSAGRARQLLGGAVTAS